MTEGWVAKRFAQHVGLVACVGAQIALIEILVPDLLIGLADALGSGVENNAEQNRVPKRARPLDDPLVGQEFLEVTPHRTVVGSVGRSQIDEQDADLLDLHRWVLGRKLAHARLVSSDSITWVFKVASISLSLQPRASV
jgi:hypothetical protein